MASEKDNIQRLVRITFSPVKTNALRVVVDAAWGVDYASIFEVRCY